MAAGESTSHMLILQLRLKITKGNIQQEPNTRFLSLSPQMLRTEVEYKVLRYQHDKGKRFNLVLLFSHQNTFPSSALCCQPCRNQPLKSLLRGWVPFFQGPASWGLIIKQILIKSSLSHTQPDGAAVKQLCHCVGRINCVLLVLP